jgi:hypothetical protein
MAVNNSVMVTVMTVLALAYLVSPATAAVTIAVTVRLLLCILHNPSLTSATAYQCSSGCCPSGWGYGDGQTDCKSKAVAL